MFHSIGDPDAFLRELHRIVKPGGMLVIDDGHQPREEAKEKILHSGVWEIAEEREAFMRCTPPVETE
ncbi:class I SAM-dependent methyltransferase [Methanogenium cariaci]|uniref:class I SAM-dependent methyltransferase n=1 Tax=Methanogenium cariaci TaxID=2197 RepID=UPI000785793E|nr:methyltransferase domain-containing protein [Methanogenium cariaci]